MIFVELRQIFSKSFTGKSGQWLPGSRQNTTLMACCCCCCCCCCYFIWPTVRVVCPNHKVVVFQSRRGTALDLGSVAIVTTFILVSSRPTCFNRFSGSFYVSLLRPTVPPSVTVRRHNTSLCSTRSPLLSRRELPSTWMSLTPATRQPPPLVSAPRAACLRLPPFPASVRLPLSPSACAQVPVSP